MIRNISHAPSSLTIIAGFSVYEVTHLELPVGFKPPALPLDLCEYGGEAVPLKPGPVCHLELLPAEGDSVT